VDRRLLALAIAGLAVCASAGAATAESRLVFRNPFVQHINDTEATCTGESVDITGLLRHNVVIVEDANGGLHSTYAIRYTLEGTTTSGTRYLGRGVNNGTEYFAPGDAPANGTFQSIFRLISTDGSPNLIVNDFFHITVNASGDVTTFTQELDVVCR